MVKIRHFQKYAKEKEEASNRKGHIADLYKAPMALIDLDHTSATIIVYPYLGFKPYTDFIKEFKPNDDEIELYNIILEMDKSECKYTSI